MCMGRLFQRRGPIILTVFLRLLVLAKEIASAERFADLVLWVWMSAVDWK